jgi:ketosteroid isomerase-like protein
MATTSINELVNQVDSFLQRKTLEDDASVLSVADRPKKMLEDTMTPGEAKLVRSQKCVEVAVHGQTTVQFSLEDLETKFGKENGTSRVTIPSTDMLIHHARTPLHETQQDVLEELTEKFAEMSKPREEKLMKKETKIEEQIKEFTENRQTADETIERVANQAEDSVILSPNRVVRRKMEEQISNALNETSSAAMKDKIMLALQKILHEGIDNHLVSQDKVTKSKWGTITNRRGNVGENKTAARVNQVLEEFQGMSVSGMKTDSFLRHFLDKLNIKLTYHNTIDARTGRRIISNEVEHDLISTWLEQDMLVFNMIEVKTAEFRPWAPPDKGRQAQAIIRLAQKALRQIVKGMLTFKEVFPDILEQDIKKIR